jgi:MT0933-like antitoxin protein
MGFMDKIKGLFRGHKQEVDSGIDKASDQIEKRVGGENAPKVEAVSDKAKDAVDKLAGTDPAAATATPVTPAAPASEPAAPPAEPPAAPPV